MWKKENVAKYKKKMRKYIARIRPNENTTVNVRRFPTCLVSPSFSHSVVVVREKWDILIYDPYYKYP